MTTGTEALNASLALMDELGATEYNARAVYCINMLCDKLYPFSDTYTAAESGTKAKLMPIAELNEPLGIDDVLAQSVLPYGLAAQLMLSDDQTQANNFEMLFQERLAEAKRQQPTSFEEIKDVYGFDNGTTINNSW